MSNDGTSESRLSDRQPPPSKGGGLVRALVYLVLIGGAGFIGWRVYQNHLQAAAQSASQAAALQSRPIPVQVVGWIRSPCPSSSARWAL